MGYNDPMPQEPEPCECGAAPKVYQLDMGIGEASGKSFVQCDECGSTGLVVMGRGMAVFF